MTRTARGVLAAAVATLAVAMVWWWRPLGEQPSLWPPAAAPNANILLVTIDTLRADRVTTALTPHLAALADAGHRFRAAYTHAPLTLPAHASIMTGLLPPDHGVRGNGAFRLDSSHLTLAERLKAHGYRTGAFVGAFVLDSRFGLDQGFDRYDGVDDDRAFAADFRYAERPASAVLRAASQWILDPAAAHGQPWFAWVHLFDPHAPYDAEGDSPQDRYDGEVRAVDRALGGFLRDVERAGSAVVIVTADHGEGLGAHGESTHGLFTYDTTMRVPLIVKGAGLGSGTHDRAVGLIDLTPTVLDLIGAPPDTMLPGQSLRHLAAADAGARPVYLEAMDGFLTAGAAAVSAVVIDGWKLIAAPIPELYELSGDPDESRNAISTAAERAQQMRVVLSPLSVTSAAPAGISVSPEAEARLRSLGYASGAARPVPAAFDEADDPKAVLPLYERFLEIIGGANDLAALQAIIKARPSFEAARMAAASLLIESGRAPEAVTLLEERAVGQGSAVRERLGAAYLAARQPDRAIAVLDPIAADGKASADAWNALGVARAQVGRAQSSRDAFNEAARLAPAAPRIRFNRALARLESGDRAGAVTDVVDLTRQSPHFKDGWKLLGSLHNDAGDRAAAVDAWQHAVALDDQEFDSLFNLAVTLGELGRAEEAGRAARRFLQTAPRPTYDRERAIVAALIVPRP
ncbi:MAG: sulfatase-like hydrolase/transferase [Vicinamibacterales bacterium]